MSQQTQDRTRTFADLFDAIVTNVGHAIQGKVDVIRLVTLTLVAEGHILIEDAPGTGKTSLAKSLAKSIDADKVIKALEGLTIDTPVGSRTIDAKTHQANTGQFWGPMVKKDGADYRVMDPITYIPAEIKE